MSVPWFPSNGSEGEYLLDELCLRCKNEQTCHILEKSWTDGPPIPEWTADDCTGKGLKCSAFDPEETAPEHEPRIQVPGQLDLLDQIGKT
jgi:hypothetical protein